MYNEAFAIIINVCVIFINSFGGGYDIPQVTSYVTKNLGYLSRVKMYDILVPVVLYKE